MPPAVPRLAIHDARAIHQAECRVVAHGARVGNGGHPSIRAAVLDAEAPERLLDFSDEVAQRQVGLRAGLHDSNIHIYCNAVNGLDSVARAHETAAERR